MASLGLKQRKCQGWLTFLVSTRIETEDGAYWETFCLNQDWNRGPTTTGKLFVSTRIGTEDLPQLGNFFSQPGLEQRLGRIIRVFNLCKGGILPYKGVRI